MPSTPKSVRSKLQRAYRHIKEFEGELDGYFKSDPGGVVIDDKSDPDNIWLTVYPKDSVPDRLPIIVGDALQNLRSSLDYLVWELVLAEGKQPGSHNMFPIAKGPTSDAFEEALKWHGKRPGNLEGIHPDAVAQIRNLQPYRWGADWEKDLLWLLNELTNINKHRRIPLATLQSGLAADMKIVERDGKLWADGRFPLANQNTGGRPISIAREVNMNPKILAYVVLDETIAKGREISSLLGGLLEYIFDGILPNFERFFA